MNSMIERGPYGAQFCLYIPPDSKEIDYQMELMMTERPESLLPVFRQVSVHGARYAYQVTGLSTLTELAAGKRLKCQQAKLLMLQLKNARQTLPDHLLSAEQVLLNPDSLFVSFPDMQIRLVYQPFLPVTDSGSEEQLITWFGKVLFRSRLMRRYWERQFDLRAAPHPSIDRRQVVMVFLAATQIAALVVTAIPLMNQSFSGSALSNTRIPLLVFFLMTIPAQLILLLPQPHEWLKSLSGLLRRMNPVLLFKKIRSILISKAEKSEAHLGRVREMPTELLSSRQETFRLATLSEGMIGTTAETAGQRAFILTEEFVVGRDFRTVDLCLSGYAVGRRHAQITRKGATFFITDLGSKNGTRLNGERLNKLVEYHLPDHCQLQFADRLFYFEAEELLDQEALDRAS